MSQYDELLAQLDAEQANQQIMAKALTAGDGEDDATIQSAAAEGAEGDEEDEDEEKEGEGKPMAKSITVGDEQVELVDADEMIKSLHDLTSRVTGNEAALTKGLQSALGMIKGQGEMIKSLHEQVNKLAGQGTGRKAVLSIHEKPAVGADVMAKSQQQGMTAGEFMAKSQAAFAAGKISGKDLTVIDVSIRQNEPIDQGLIAKVCQ